MTEILKLVLAFAPWLAFLVISGHSMIRLQIGIITATVLTIVMAVARLHRGAIMWGGFIFFAFALIYVVWLRNVWVIHNMGILASGTLFLAAQVSIFIGRPFTEDYAREQATEDVWKSVSFIRSCYTTTAFWSYIFLVNTALNAIKTYCSGTDEVVMRILEYSVLFSGIIFTRVYVIMTKKKRAIRENSTPAGTKP